jgi:hypothetical protein
MKAVAILLGTFILALLGGAADASTLTVVGEGVFQVPADVVYVSIRATAEDDNLSLASMNSSEILNRTTEALIEAGVDPEDFSAGRGRSASRIQTTSRVYNNSTVVAVADEAVSRVTEEVTIRFDAQDEALINITLEVARAEGADASISGYGLEDVDEAFAQARQRAVEDAEIEAEALASAAGLKLGKRLEIFEPASPEVSQPTEAYDPLALGMISLFDFTWPLTPYSSDPFSSSSPWDTATPAEPGMLEVRSQVVVNYEVTS